MAASGSLAGAGGSIAGEGVDSTFGSATGGFVHTGDDPEGDWAPVVAGDGNISENGEVDVGSGAPKGESPTGSAAGAGVVGGGPNGELLASGSGITGGT